MTRPPTPTPPASSVPPPPLPQSQIVLDPYARAVYSRRRWGQMGPDLPYGDPSVLGLMPTWPQVGGWYGIGALC